MYSWLHARTPHTMPNDLFAMMYDVTPKTTNPAVMPKNHQRLSTSWPGTRCKLSQPLQFCLVRVHSPNTFMPHMPVTMFMGSTMVPSTVSFPRTSLVLSARSFIFRLICAR